VNRPNVHVVILVASNWNNKHGKGGEKVGKIKKELGTEKHDRHRRGCAKRLLPSRWSNCQKRKRCQRGQKNNSELAQLVGCGKRALRSNHFFADES